MRVQFRVHALLIKSYNNNNEKNLKQKKIFNDINKNEKCPGSVCLLIDFLYNQGTNIHFSDKGLSAMSTYNILAKQKGINFTLPSLQLELLMVATIKSTAYKFYPFRSKEIS